MAYGAGLSQLYADAGQEETRERGRYEREIAAAEKAAKKESKSRSLWGGIGGGLGALVSFIGSGFNPKAAMKGYTYGKEAGKWGRRLTSDYDASDYNVSTDTGKFGKSQKYALQDINRQLEAADEGQFWKDVTDTGISLASIGIGDKLSNVVGRAFPPKLDAAIPNLSKVSYAKEKGAEALGGHWGDILDKSSSRLSPGSSDMMKYLDWHEYGDYR